MSTIVTDTLQGKTSATSITLPTTEEILKESVIVVPSADASHQDLHKPC